ncbi:MAG: VWA domain-containing protein [Gammaproteobacteria bacterium]|nr:VWA domain-containing protein [Gammaproteobacteria bacterium]
MPAPALMPVDVRVVVDVSTHTSPARFDMNRQGLELLVQSLPDSAKAGVWTFAHVTRQVAKYGPADMLWKQVAAIHARNLKQTSSSSVLADALRVATWDMLDSDRGVSHVVVFSDGHMSKGRGDKHVDKTRDSLLQEWATQLKLARVVVHTVVTGDGGDVDLLRQIAHLSGGIHQRIDNVEQMQNFVLGVLQFVQLQPQAVVDDSGRFQIAPGAEVLSLMWLRQDADVVQPTLLRPDGTRLSRYTPLENGRWLLAERFEMASIEEPQPGWWQVMGAQPQKVAVFGEIDILIEGLGSTVIPSDESSALIKLYSAGEHIKNTDFLDLLSVRAWLNSEGDRVPLPVDRVGSGFEAFFVSLQDGSHDLEVQIIAPTFVRQVKYPFAATNPIKVEIVENQAGEAVAWVYFTHADVDYRSVKSTAKVRKPPKVGSLVPGIKLPAGLWQIPINETEGIIEISFSMSGNLLNKKGYFLKTRPITLNLPLPENVKHVYRFDAQGNLIARPEPMEVAAMGEGVLASAPGNVGSAQGLSSKQGSAVSQIPQTASATALISNAQVAFATPATKTPLLPLWFAGLIVALNLGLGALIWWMFRSAPLGFELRQAEVEPA